MVSISFVALVELWNFASMLQELKQQELDLMAPEAPHRFQYNLVRWYEAWKLNKVSET